MGWGQKQEADVALHPVLLCVEAQQWPPCEIVAVLSMTTKGLWAKCHALRQIDRVLLRAWK